MQPRAQPRFALTRQHLCVRVAGGAPAAALAEGGAPEAVGADGEALFELDTSDDQPDLIVWAAHGITHARLEDAFEALMCRDPRHAASAAPHHAACRGMRAGGADTCRMFLPPVVPRLASTST